MSDSIPNATRKLFEAISVFQLKPPIRPEKEHFGSHIELTDFMFNENHLITRLTETIVDWVYSKKQAKEIFMKEFGEGDYGSASTRLYQSAKQTFRISAPQGQFGELLLSSFLQFLFHANPLLRKQSVRTSDNHERFGADAIHVAVNDTVDLYLGESKCYKSSYQFPKAFEESLSSINSTMTSFASEIQKFTVGGFIEEDLRELASNVLSNRVKVSIHPVSIIIYNETAKLSANADAIRDEIRNSILHQCRKIDKKVYESIDDRITSRMTYIIVPVWNLDDLLDKFVKAL